MEENDTSPGGETVTDSAEEKSSVDALAEILDDPDDEQDTGEEEAEAGDDSEDDAEDVTREDDESEEGTEDAEDDEDATEDPEASDGDEETDDSGEIKGGRIAPLNAKVRMPDGSLTTIEELRSSYFRRGDYTQKMQAISEDRKVLETDRESVSQTKQHLSTQLDRAQQMLDAWRPQQPQTPYEQDPLAWGKYQAEQAGWDHWQKQLDAARQETTERETKEQEESLRKRLSEENTRLVEKIPSLADQGKRQAFFTEAAKTMAEYGFSQEEIGTISDHRMVVVMRDLMKAKRLAQKAPQVKQQIKDKPKMLKGGKRSNPGAAKKQGATERLGRLRETGSTRDGVATLMDLDL